MLTFKVESRNDKDAVMERFTVVAPDLDSALEAARADQEEQWPGTRIRITSVVETAERVVGPLTAAKRANA